MSFSWISLACWFKLLFLHCTYSQDNPRLCYFLWNSKHISLLKLGLPILQIGHQVRCFVRVREKLDELLLPFCSIFESLEPVRVPQMAFDNHPYNLWKAYLNGMDHEFLLHALQKIIMHMKWKHRYFMTIWMIDPARSSMYGSFTYSISSRTALNRVSNTFNSKVEYFRHFRNQSNEKSYNHSLIAIFSSDFLQSPVVFCFSS